MLPGASFQTDRAASTSYHVTIDLVEKHDDYNSISWDGHIQGNDGQRYNVSFTQGQSLTVGGPETPAWYFTLQSHNGAGWIAASRRLFRTPGETDAVYPKYVRESSPDGSDSG